jgi:hypothetical protein
MTNLWPSQPVDKSSALKESRIASFLQRKRSGLAAVSPNRFKRANIADRLSCHSREDIKVWTGQSIVLEARRVAPSISPLIFNCIYIRLFVYFGINLVRPCQREVK